MKKKDIYIDLSQLTKKERGVIYAVLVASGEDMFIWNELDELGNYESSSPYLVFNGVSWCESANVEDKTKLTYFDFLKLFEPEMKNYFKVGDKVYCHHYGWGKVRFIGNNGHVVQFSDNISRNIPLHFLSFTEYTIKGMRKERIKI